MIMMQMQWAGVSLDQYDEVKRQVNWERDKPVGGVFHTTAHDGDGLRISDVWRSADDFKTFVDTRLMPAVQQLGIATQPEAHIFEAHDVFAPAFQPATLA